MLPEIASSPDDHPALRTALRIGGEETNRQRELRAFVSSVLTIQRETWVAPGDDASKPDMALLLISRDSHLVATFEGRLLFESEMAYETLDQALGTVDHLALFRASGDSHLVHVVSGRPNPKPRPVWINIALFVATLFSVLLVGTGIAIGEVRFNDPRAAAAIASDYFINLWRGLPYALSILGILGAHELGHYFAARAHRIAVTLPYFIPAPFISLLGTFGAFIQLRQPMRNRKSLMDIGAAGPLVGLAVAIPILVIGLATSQVAVVAPGGDVEGNSFLYALLKTLVFGRFLPSGGEDVYVNQMAWAGWTGLLVTSLNLIPLGQLDGGHILFSLIGETARKFYYPLLLAMVGLVVLVSDVWLFWVVLLFLFGRVYAAPLDMITPLDRRRTGIGILSAVVFLVTFMPVPFTVSSGGTETIGDAVFLPGGMGLSAVMMLAVGMIILWTRRKR